MQNRFGLMVASRSNIIVVGLRYVSAWNIVNPLATTNIAFKRLQFAIWQLRFPPAAGVMEEIKMGDDRAIRIGAEVDWLEG